MGHLTPARTRALVIMTVLVAGVCAGCARASTSDSALDSSKTRAQLASEPLAKAAKTAFPKGITLAEAETTGGTVALFTQLVVPYLKQELGVPVTLVDDAGGGGLQAWRAVYHAQSDSALIIPCITSQPALVQDFADPSTKTMTLTPIYQLFGQDAVVMLAGKGSKYHSLAQISNAKTTVTVASISPGTTGSWLAAAYLAVLDHLNIKLVPFSSGGQATAAALGGSVDATMALETDASKLIKQGSAQGIVQFGPSAISALPGVQSIVAAGHPQQTLESSEGFYGPPGMPAAQVDVLSRAFRELLTNSSFLAKATGESFVPAPEDATALGNQLKSLAQTIAPDISKFRRVA